MATTATAQLPIAGQEHFPVVATLEGGSQKETPRSRHLMDPVPGIRHGKTGITIAVPGGTTRKRHPSASRRRPTRRRRPTLTGWPARRGAQQVPTRPHQLGPTSGAGGVTGLGPRWRAGPHLGESPGGAISFRPTGSGGALRTGLHQLEPPRGVIPLQPTRPGGAPRTGLHPRAG